jgi:long-chain acyl-CoA synthetase
LRETGTGELVVRGATVMQRYWDRPEDTAAVLRPGHLLYTGDIFRIDDQGYMYFLARRDDMIKSRGEKVSPKEVENVLHELSGVAEAVVFGIPDALLGQALKTCVVLVAGAAVTEQDVLRHCAGRLEDYMVPKVVEFVPAMPRTATGKLNRRELSGHAAR